MIWIKVITKVLGIFTFVFYGLSNKGEKQVEAKDYWLMWTMALVQFIVWW